MFLLHLLLAFPIFSKLPLLISKVNPIGLHGLSSKALNADVNLVMDDGQNKPRQHLLKEFLTVSKISTPPLLSDKALNIFTM